MEATKLGADGIADRCFGQFLRKLLDRMNFGGQMFTLPPSKHRGGASSLCLIQGDEEVGVTIMEMVRQMDAGDMISRRSIPITDEDNVTS